LKADGRWLKRAVQVLLEHQGLNAGDK
jgi:hypothetical protein